MRPVPRAPSKPRGHEARTRRHLPPLECLARRGGIEPRPPYLRREYVTSASRLSPPAFLLRARPSVRPSIRLPARPPARPPACLHQVRLEHMLRRLQVLQEAAGAEKPCQVLPAPEAVFLGGAVAADSHHILRHLGITHIVNATEVGRVPWRDEARGGGSPRIRRMSRTGKGGD